MSEIQNEAGTDRRISPWASALLSIGLEVLAAWATHHARRNAEVAPEQGEALKAAALLGVEIDADVDAIRRALREKLASTRLHPDQGGDADLTQALVAAKNLLVERARSRVGE